MATTRPFAYNIGDPIAGTEQVGNLAVGYPDPSSGYNDAVFWNGPDEDLGYVIAQQVPNNNQPTPVPDDALTLSTTYKGTDIQLSNNNQTATQLFGYQQSVLAETLISGSDKVMFSVLCNLLEPSVGIGGHVIGVGRLTMNYQGNPYGGYPGTDAGSIGFSDAGDYYYNGTVQTTDLPTWGDGDTIDIAISHGQYWWIRVNGGNWNNNPSANPTTLSNGLSINGLTNFYPALCPSYQGIMTVLNYPKYGVPSTYDFLGNVSASVGFLRTDDFTDESFISLAQTVSSAGGTPQTFASATGASSWLTSNGYWNSYIYPVLSLDAAGYTSGNWVDSVGGRNFVLQGTPSWTDGTGGAFNFNPNTGDYAECSTSLPDLNTWTVAVWHSYEGTNTGSNPCIITEQYPGNTGQINYSIGDNNGVFSAGFFNGGWQVTDGYTLTPGGWYFIVGTYDGTTVKLYINNTLVDSTNYTGTPISSQGGIRLMRRWDYPDYWGGKLAKVDIYNKSLTSSQINSIWDSTKSRFGF